MKYLITLALGAALCVSCDDKKDEGTSNGEEASTTTTDNNAPVALTSLEDSASYAIGLNIATSLKQQGVTSFNSVIMAKAIDDILAGKEGLIAQQDINTVVQGYFSSQKESQYAQNKTKSESWLAENAKKDGIIVLPSGLQYEIITEGTGEKPTLQSTVKAHYKGTRIDGTQFDSSYDRGEPSSFQVTGVIRGWTEALQLMPVGSKWKLYIPQDLAYGANPRPGGAIQPYDALIFDIELIEIEK